MESSSSLTRGTCSLSINTWLMPINLSRSMLASSIPAHKPLFSHLILCAYREYKRCSLFSVKRQSSGFTLRLCQSPPSPHRLHTSSSMGPEPCWCWTLAGQYLFGFCYTNLEGVCGSRRWEEGCTPVQTDAEVGRGHCIHYLTGSWIPDRLAGYITNSLNQEFTVPHIHAATCTM